MIGGLASCGYLPFKMIFNQAGKPGIQTLLYTLICMTNIVFNLLLIPFFGIWGAATATALSYAGQAIFIKHLAAKRINLRI